MLTKQSLTDALLIVGHYKKELHRSMLTAPIEKLAEIRMNIDGLKLLETRMKNEIKDENNEWIATINKEGE